MRAELLVALAACGRLRFDPIQANDGAAVLDAPQHALCPAWGPWSAPAVLPEFAGGAPDLDPSFSADRSELWLVSSNSTLDIAVAMRDGSGTYGNITVAPFSSGLDDIDPALSADGLTLVYLSGAAADSVREVRRSSVLQPFGSPVPALGLESTSVLSMDLSADGLELYYETAAELVRVSRMTRDMPFGAPTPLGFVGRWPSISSDGLELYFQRGASPGNTFGFVRTRATIGDAFGNETPFINLPADLNGDFEITADGRELWFTTYDGSLNRLTRACP